MNGLFAVVVEVFLCGFFEELGVLAFAFVDFVEQVLLFADHLSLLFEFLYLNQVQAGLRLVVFFGQCLRQFLAVF